MSSMKEMAIRDYISKIDFKHDDWKVSRTDEERCYTNVWAIWYIILFRL